VAHVRLSRRARQDLIGIWVSIARHDIAAADRAYAKLLACTTLLARHPQAGRRRPEIAPAARSLAERPYVILYCLEDAGVRVVRVLHGARDLTHEAFDDDAV
jgi:toxin ParE1/3/4